MLCHRHEALFSFEKGLPLELLHLLHDEIPDGHLLHLHDLLLPHLVHQQRLQQHALLLIGRRRRWRRRLHALFNALDGEVAVVMDALQPPPLHERGLSCVQDGA